MSYLTDSKGCIAVDYIGRFENLQEDFAVICERLKIEKVQLPVKNKSEGKHYRKYYTQSSRELVEIKLAKELEMFKYEF
jgi:hypothetical protein